MTTLAADLSATAETLQVDAAVADPAPYYKIDNEVVRVLQPTFTAQDGTSPNRTRSNVQWVIERGAAETTAATHSSGATLTPLYDQVGTPAVDTGGAAQTVSLLGPFALTSAQLLAAAIDPEGNGQVELADLAEDTLVVKAWAMMSWSAPTSFDGDAPVLALQVTSADGLTESAMIAQYDLSASDQTAPLFEALPLATPSGFLRSVAIAPANGKLQAALSYANEPDGRPTEGNVTIYALIATAA